ncbi:helix-turn-helix domain-containing protein [Terasakiella sp.]|uniref:helix-turn-helix domain-containing protein n=1 Tax=Terasakiella sp. TaxID=2034861 RepID=UPI003AA885BD
MPHSKLRSARRRMKYTQGELAKLAKVNLNTVSNLENGKGTISSFIAISKVLGIRIEQKPDNIPVGSWVAALRNNKDISQRELAILSGVSRSAVREIESNSRGRLRSLWSLLSALDVKPRLHKRGKSMVPRSGNDVVYTPRPLAKWIVDHFQPTGRILEPCRGDGAFLDYMPGADWCELALGCDFFEYQGKVDWIVTNPPWSLLREFLHHSMKIADHVVMVITLNSLWTKARKRDIKDAGFGVKEIMLIDSPPPPWPHVGMQVGIVYFQKGWKGDIRLTDHRGIAPVRND